MINLKPNFVASKLNYNKYKTIQEISYMVSLNTSHSLVYYITIIFRSHNNIIAFVASTLHCQTSTTLYVD
jgi:hypothetical protein